MTFKKALLGTIAAATLTVSAAFATVPAQTSSCSYQFSSNLRLGAVSTDVQNLQKLLNMDAATKVASTGAGSMGSETLRFGPATFAAVKKFQAANGITPMSGYVGPLTRGVLNTICSSSAPVTNTNTNTGSGVTANNIPVSVLVQGQVGAKLGEFVVSGNGNVTQIELMRTGLSNNSALRNVYLYDGATRLTDGASVLTDGTIRFSSASGITMVSGSKTLTVRADIDSAAVGGSNTSGQTVGVAMKSVTMMGGTSTPVVGVNGPLFSISSADMATVSFTGSNTSVGVALPGLNSGTMNYNVWGGSLNVGQRAVNLRSFSLKQIGSAPVTALTNVRLVIDGTVKGTAVANANGLYVFDMMSAPAMISTGNHTFEVRADIVAGASRNFYFSLENQADASFEDTQLPGIYTSVGNFANVKTGNTINIGQGSFTLQQDPSFTTTQIVGGSSNATIGKFIARAFGEDVKVQTLNITTAFGTTPLQGNYGLQNVAVYVDGAQVGTSVNQSTVGAQTYNLGSQLIVAAGKTSVIEIKADLRTSTSTNYTSGTVKADITSNATGGQGMISQNIVAIPTGTANNLTIVNTNADLQVKTGFGTQALSPNTVNQKIGSFTLNVQNVEGVNVTNIAVNLAGTAALNTYGNITVTDGSQTIGLPSASNNFSVNFTVPANTSKQIDVYADLNNVSASATIIPTLVVTYRGVVSQNNTSSTMLGSTVTVNTGTVNTPTLAGSSATAQLVVKNAQLGIATFNVTGASGSSKLTKLGFSSTNNVISAITINGVTTSFSNNAATTTFTTPIDIPNGGSGASIPVTVTFSDVGIGANSSASTSALTLTTMEYTSGGNTTMVGGMSVASNVMTLVAGKPVVTTTNSTVALQAGSQKIGEVTVGADTSAIRLNKVSFNVSVSSAGTLNLAAIDLRDGNTAVSGAVCSPLTVAVNTSAVVACTLPANYDISAGSTKTLNLYATVAGTFGTAGQSQISAGLSNSGTDFGWVDFAGNSTTVLDGQKILNFPTGAYTSKN